MGDSLLFLTSQNTLVQQSFERCGSTYQPLPPVELYSGCNPVQFQLDRHRIWLLECSGELFFRPLQAGDFKLWYRCKQERIHSNFLTREYSLLLASTQTDHIEVDSLDLRFETVYFSLVNKRLQRKKLAELGVRIPKHSGCVRGFTGYSPISNPSLILKSHKHSPIVICALQFDFIFGLGVRDDHSYNRSHHIQLLFMIDLSQMCIDARSVWMLAAGVRSTSAPAAVVRNSWESMHLHSLVFLEDSPQVLVCSSQRGVSSLTSISLRDN